MDMVVDFSNQILASQDGETEENDFSTKNWSFSTAESDLETESEGLSEDVSEDVYEDVEASDSVVVDFSDQIVASQDEEFEEENDSFPPEGSFLINKSDLQIESDLDIEQNDILEDVGDSDLVVDEVEKTNKSDVVLDFSDQIIASQDKPKENISKKSSFSNTFSSSNLNISVDSDVPAPNVEEIEEPIKDSKKSNNTIIDFTDKILARNQNKPKNGHVSTVIKKSVPVIKSVDISTDLDVPIPDVKEIQEIEKPVEENKNGSDIFVDFTDKILARNQDKPKNSHSSPVIKNPVVLARADIFTDLDPVVPEIEENEDLDEDVAEDAPRDKDFGFLVDFSDQITASQNRKELEEECFSSKDRFDPVIASEPIKQVKQKTIEKEEIKGWNFEITSRDRNGFIQAFTATPIK